MYCSFVSFKSSVICRQSWNMTCFKNRMRTSVATSETACFSEDVMGLFWDAFWKSKRKLHSWESRRFVVVYLFECCTSVWHSLPCTSKAFLFSRHTFVNGGPACQTEFSPDSSCLWSRAFTLKSVINVTGCRCTQCLLTLTVSWGILQASCGCECHTYWLFFFFFEISAHTLRIRIEERWHTCCHLIVWLYSVNVIVYLQAVASVILLVI